MIYIDGSRSPKFHFTLDFEGVKDQRNSNEWKVYMATTDDLFFELLDITLGTRVKKRVGLTQN